MSGSDAVALRGLVVRYGAQDVVKGIDLAVGPGEVVSLLGPSGCGKTTTLRAVAGFAPAASGSVLLHGRDVTRLPANRREVGLVFQGYALFPHLSVFENVAYGLRRRKVPGAEIAERVGAALALVQLSGLAARRPRQLSGGQQQRVAIARALVIRPRVLLLDEPLSNLDAKLRGEMRSSLRELLKRQGIASVFVTHDQEEAIVLSDRIFLMNEGRIEQVGTPRDMYGRPATLFAAAFLGQANFLEGVTTAASRDRATVRIGERLFAGVAARPLQPGARATLVVKHERVRLAAGPEDGNLAPATYLGATFLGPGIQLRCRYAGQAITAVLPAGGRGEPVLGPDSPLTLAFDPADALVFPSGPSEP